MLSPPHHKKKNFRRGAKVLLITRKRIFGEAQRNNNEPGSVTLVAADPVFGLRARWDTVTSDQERRYRWKNLDVGEI
jgi:hypothetical protein